MAAAVRCDHVMMMVLYFRDGQIEKENYKVYGGMDGNAVGSGNRRYIFVQRVCDTLVGCDVSYGWQLVCVINYFAA